MIFLESSAMALSLGVLLLVTFALYFLGATRSSGPVAAGSGPARRALLCLTGGVLVVSYPALPSAVVAVVAVTFALWVVFELCEAVLSLLRVDGMRDVWRSRSGHPSV